MDTSNSTKKVPQDSSRGIKVLSLCNRIFHMFDDKTRIACLSDLVFCAPFGTWSHIVRVDYLV